MTDHILWETPGLHSATEKWENGKGQDELKQRDIPKEEISYSEVSPGLTVTQIV